MSMQAPLYHTPDGWLGGSEPLRPPYRAARGLFPERTLSALERAGWAAKSLQLASSSGTGQGCPAPSESRTSEQRPSAPTHDDIAGAHWDKLLGSRGRQNPPMTTLLALRGTISWNPTATMSGRGCIRSHCDRSGAAGDLPFTLKVAACTAQQHVRRAQHMRLVA